MFFKILRILCLLFVFNLSFINFSNSDILKKIEIFGNDRISNETIAMFSEVEINDNINSNIINKVLKNLYDTNFFQDVSIKFTNNILEIKVVENPIIQNITYEGIKSNRIKDLIVSSTKLKSRSSFNDLIFRKDKENIKSELKILGYYFPSIETYIEDLKDNKINLTYKINLGEKAKIKKYLLLEIKNLKIKN